MVHEFNSTDIVEFLSGSLPMTVIGNSGSGVECEWFNPVTGKFQQKAFRAQYLRKVPQDGKRTA